MWSRDLNKLAGKEYGHHAYSDLLMIKHPRATHTPDLLNPPHLLITAITNVTDQNTNFIEAYYDRVATVGQDGQVVLPHPKLLDEFGSDLAHLSLESGPKHIPKSTT
jgi:hypothetical protein